MQFYCFIHSNLTYTKFSPNVNDPQEIVAIVNLTLLSCMGDEIGGLSTAKKMNTITFAYHDLVMYKLKPRVYLLLQVIPGVEDSPDKST